MEDLVITIGETYYKGDICTPFSTRQVTNYNGYDVWYLADGSEKKVTTVEEFRQWANGVVPDLQQYDDGEWR